MHPWLDFFPLETQEPQQGWPVTEQQRGEVGLPVGLSVVRPQSHKRVRLLSIDN